MRCSRCNRKLKHGGYNGTQYGIVCYALLFDRERKPRKIKRVDSDGQADLFCIIAEEKEHV